MKKSSYLFFPLPRLTAAPRAIRSPTPAAVAEPHIPRPTPVPLRQERVCQSRLCLTFLNDLYLNPAFFDSKYDRCFCSVFFPQSSPEVWSVAGSKYAAPLKWTRFGLHIDSTFASDHDIFRQWHTSYYATSVAKLPSIIGNRFIPFSGDELLHGDLFNTNVPNSRYVYTSPSVHYACRQHSCPSYRVRYEGELYDVQVMLQCKQNPDGVQKRKGTVAHRCTLIPDDEIDWQTDLRSSVLPYALLIRATKSYRPWSMKLLCDQRFRPDKTNISNRSIQMVTSSRKLLITHVFLGIIMNLSMQNYRRMYLCRLVLESLQQRLIVKNVHFFLDGISFFTNRMIAVGLLLV